MITLISSITKKSNDEFTIATTAVSNVDNSIASSGAGITVRDTNAIQGALIKCIAIASTSATKLAGDSEDQSILRRMSANPNEDSETRHQAELNRLTNTLRQKIADYTVVNNALTNMRREFNEYRLNSQKTIQDLLSKGSDSNSNVEAMLKEDVALNNTAVNNGTVVLNAKLLNDAIKNKEKLETRTCSKCNSMIIAPISVHDNQIVCSRCNPQTIENLELLSTGLSSPAITNTINVEDYNGNNNTSSDPCENCNEDCEGCDHHYDDDDNDYDNDDDDN